jgi:hypothetical protein
LSIQTEDKDLAAIVKNYQETIKEETLALSLSEVTQPTYEATVKVNGKQVTIKLAKTAG